MPTQAERLAKVETRLDALGADVAEIKGDVKTLLNAHNSQSGASKVWATLAAALLALGGAIGGAFVAKGH